MEKTTFSLGFYIRKTRTNKKGEAAIQVRVTVNGMRADTTVKETITPKLWNDAKGKAYERNPLTKELNMYLDAVRAKFMRIHRDMEMDGEEYITAQKVMDRYLGKDQSERHTLVELFREHNEKCRKLSGIDMAPATVQRYETCLKHTQEFMQYTYKRSDIYLDEMNRQFIEDYEFYLKTVCKCNHNTTTKYLKNFKKITRIAIQKEWMKKDPFADIKFSLNPVEKDFLEKHEIEIIRQKEIGIERLALVRDIFVFCCFTGLAFSDVKQLTPEHISIDINGDKWIRKMRQKTKNMCNIPLLEVAQEILAKYENHPYCVTKGVLLPVLSNQKMNTYLKELIDICNIKKTITTHLARHTFATMMLTLGADLYTTSKLLGHADVKMTQVYAKIINQKKDDAVNLVNGLFD